MIVTVTPNTALDYTLRLPLLRMGHTARATQTALGMGGKPTDASWILGELGVPSLALGCAAGFFGQKAVQLLEARGVTVDFTWVSGETRLNTVIVTEDGAPNTTITTSTLVASESDLARLEARFVSALDAATCVVTGGSLPQGVAPSLFARFIALARARSIPVIFDAEGATLRAGLEARPDFIKPNRDEFEALIGGSLPTLEALHHAARKIAGQYGTSPIITLGREGMLAVLPGRTWYIPALDVPVLSAAGAGDAILAGLAAALDRGQPIEDGLRLGAAAAAAVCMQLGTADCRREDVERLLPQVQLIEYQPGGGPIYPLSSS